MSSHWNIVPAAPCQHGVRTGIVFPPASPFAAIPFHFVLEDRPIEVCEEELLIPGIPQDRRAERGAEGKPLRRLLHLDSDSRKRLPLFIQHANSGVALAKTAYSLVRLLFPAVLLAARDGSNQRYRRYSNTETRSWILNHGEFPVEQHVAQPSPSGYLSRLTPPTLKSFVVPLKKVRSPEECHCVLTVRGAELKRRTCFAQFWYSFAQ